ncbi:DEAD-domain-containing protein [Karstenula rhodostoma CBS 690.94]|uniref:ATP-dependent RNA helicase n=1 Tax=Karstenula rhodostoma CBS 690.94 TaxID=1392251 RepID=A0A9P4P8W9_9PLEO|nr:DEAD-domain-containing protein [Karstenula rhodostoma CBS 690.94]
MKRPHAAQKPAHPTHKRQKLEKPATPAPAPAPAPAKSSAPRRKIRLDDLSWKAVSMPDRLEDFEGFCGLDEIDDVEVVRDGATLSFGTRKTAEQIEKEKEEGRKREAEETRYFEEMRDRQGEVDLNVDVEGEAVESEWEGFSDGDGEGKGDARGDGGKEGKEAKSVEDKGKKDKEQHEDTKPVKEAKGKEAKGKKDKEQHEKDTKPAKEAKGKKDKEQHESSEPQAQAIGSGAFDILADKSEDEDEGDVDVSAWEDIGLSKETLASLSKLKFSEPTTIQSLAIPEVLAGRDVIGKASTGSGKTLAFGIPILESYLKSPPAAKNHAPIALIISPTRELAHQLSAHLTALCADGDFKAPSIATVTGGLAVQKQRRQLENADVIVGTPGRLWEVISSGQGLLASIKRIRFLVVDEADRLLSQGSYKELGEILKILDRDDNAGEGAAPTPAAEIQRQTLVFSATFHKGLQQKLAGKGPKGGGDLMNKQESMEYLLKKLNFREEKPKFIDANPTSQMATGLKEGLIECAGTEKDLFLYSLLLYHPKKRALIFTNSVSAVRRITPFLQNLDLPALPLHSGMIQKARLRSIERFTQRPGSILVATDVAARGLDIPGVELIVHYHLPRAADTYVHRSGRTARGSASGASILICAPEEVAGVRRLVAKVHARNEAAPGKKKSAYFIRTLDIDRRIVARLKPRAVLSKRIADTTIAKEKKHSEDDWMRTAAEELGVDYDSESFEKEAKGRKGRGAGRKKKEKEASQLTKGEMGALRAELKGLLAQRVNVGVSERYLTSGGIDVEALMRGEGNLEFLGDAGALGFED